MASKLSGWVDEAVGAALIVAGVFAVWYLPPLAPYLISAGAGLMLTGVGTLIATMGGLTGVHTLSRNPIKPWDVIYGRARVAGTNLYTKEWGDNNKYVDIVAVLACHPCKDVYAVLFNGRMVQIDTTAVPTGVPASTFPAINGGTSFSPVQESHTCSSIIRANNVVTVTTQDIPLLIENEYVQMSEVTADPTLNGAFSVSAILGRSGGNITFQYLCGGLPITIGGSQGIITTMWVDYGRHVYVEFLMGTQTLGETFVGMTIGTPNEGDPTDLQHPPVNPWTANHSAVGRTVAFIRLNYDSTIFANGIPQISFLIHGKNDIVDPRGSPPTVGYTENSALCFADYMTNQVWGFRCAFGDEIDTDELAADANICDEIVALSTAVPMAITGAVLSVVTDFTQASGLAGDAWVKGPVGFTPWIAATSGYSKRTDTYTLTSGDIAELEAGTFIAICEIVTDARGGVAFPGAFNIYDTWIDVTFGDGSTATWRAATATAAGTPAPANPELANDAYVSTFTTLSLLASEVHESGGVVVLSGYIGPISYSSGTEPRYTCNGQFDLSMPAGQILGNILSSCGGRLTTSAGQFRCNPAAYPGVSLALTGPTGAMQILANSFRWRPKASVHDLFNAVKGTYISPSTNWQVSDFPPYMQDSLHGYASGSPLDPFGDANLAADSGERRYLDVQLPMTISCPTAQRLAKLELRRRRQQGTGTFPFNLWATQLAALDVVAMDLPYFGWVGKLLEVAAWRFTFTEKGGAIALGTEVDVQETDPSVYDWNPAMDQLTPQGYASLSTDPPGTGNNVTVIAGPTGVTLLSDATTVSIGGGNVAGSQIKVSWTAPSDGFLSYIQIQYQVDASPLGPWLASPNAPPNVTVAFIPNVVNGTNYLVQLRSVDVNGAASLWAQYGPVTAGGATGQLFAVNGT